MAHKLQDDKYMTTGFLFKQMNNITLKAIKYQAKIMLFNFWIKQMKSIR